MPTKYSDRLILPIEGFKDIEFSTKNGLKIANGYKTVSICGKPYIEFEEHQINKENIAIPDNGKWRVKNVNANQIEYRSKDYCSIKIIQQKSNNNFYISPFDLRSNKYPVLIKALKKKKITY